MTSRSCRLCDAGGHHPFPSDRLLHEHLALAHQGRQLCGVCVKAGCRFMLEQGVFTRQELDRHVRDSHPRCEFCREHFYGGWTGGPGWVGVCVWEGGRWVRGYVHHQCR